MVKTCNYAVYLGANFNYDNGWRDHSESYLETFYSDFRYRNDDTELSKRWSSLYRFKGKWSTPLTLMDLEGSDAVYTYPDNTHNKKLLSKFWWKSFFVNDQLSIQGNMYYRHMERRNYNGDEFEGKDCGL